MPKITLENITKSYRGEKRRFVPAVSDINLTIEQGEFVFLTGSSGAGKSTLLGIIAGSIRPDRGRVLLDSCDVTHGPRWLCPHITRKFGQVWQEPSLIRRQTIGENLSLAVMIGGVRRGSGRAVASRVRKVLGLVGMRGCEDKYPVEMSSGECRRIELARALINSPPILLLDELTANLDDDSIWDMFQLLDELNRRGTTVIMATHASQYVNIMRKRVVTIVDGRIMGDVPKGRYGEIV